jgi:autophagy-related protein 9
MNSFSSPLLTVIAKNIVFMFGGLLSIFLLLTVYDEDILQVQHVVTIMSVLGVVVVIARYSIH